MRLDPNWLIALLGIGVTVLIAATAALWKLATRLATLDTRVDSEFKRDGKGTVKDDLHDLKDRISAISDDSAAAKIAAKFANDQAAKAVTAFDELARRLDETIRQGNHDIGGVQQQVRQVQHDVTSVRTSIAILVDHIERINYDRLQKEKAWYEAAKIVPGFLPPLPTGVGDLPPGSVPEQEQPADADPGVSS